MSKVGGRRLVLLVAACVAVGAGCSSTTPGTAVTPSQPQDGSAVVSLMDSGSYPTAAQRAYGVVGDDVVGQNVLEAHRIAEFTVGPWEVDEELRQFPGALNAGLVGPIASPKWMRDNGVFGGSLPEVAGSRGFSFGFSTIRTTAPQQGQVRGLQNVVLRFPDAAAAATAAQEMSAQAPPPPNSGPPRPVPIANTPEALATAFDMPDGSERVDSFTPHGPYVLYQSARAAQALLGQTPAGLVDKTLVVQKRRIDEFAATDPSALRDLPLDPTGQLLARTLGAPDNRAPFIAGVWQARGWLHFEDDPVAATALFNTAGVDVVTQRLTTVYQAANPDGARRVEDELATQMGSTEAVKSIEGVAGLPVAQCFERTNGGVPSTSPVTWQRIEWPYKCVARTDRYAYTAFSDSPTDVRQQMAAQYRILAGE